MHGAARRARLRRVLAVQGETALAAVVALAWAVGILCFAALPPVFQWESFHRFADGRPLLGVRNGANVLSNVPFFLVAAAGLLAVARRPEAFADPWERRAFATLFLLVALVGVGSTYYHLAPSTERLFWDRLPLAMVFMAIFGLVLGERLDGRAGAAPFTALVATGFLGTLWWRMSGDLRLYGLVQLFALLAVPLLLLLRPGRYDRTKDLAWMAALYGAAKVCEALDQQIFTVGVSGHTLKHLLAATAVGALVLHLARRRAR